MLQITWPNLIVDCPNDYGDFAQKHHNRLIEPRAYNSLNKAVFMKITQIRNATQIIDYAGIIKS